MVNPRSICQRIGIVVLRLAGERLRIRPDRDKSRMILLAVHLENGVEEHVGAVGAVLPARQLARRVADAVHARDEDHPHRHEPRDVLRVVTRAAWQPRRLQAQVRGDRLDGRLNFRRRDRRRRVSIGVMVIVVPVSSAIVWARAESLSRGAAIFSGNRSRNSSECFTRPGTTFRAPGEHLQPSDVSHLPPRLGRHDGLDDLDQFRGGQQRIPPFGHRRRARVVREAADLHVVLVDADDAFDDANGDAGFEEVAALLDVQLQVAVEGARRQARIAEARRIAAEPANAVSAREAVRLVQRPRSSGDDRPQPRDCRSCRPLRSTR